MSGQQQGGGAPSTRWTPGQKQSGKRRGSAEDEWEELGQLVIFGVVVLVVAGLALPTLVVFAVTAVVWKWRRWSAWWLAVGALAVLPAGWLFGWRDPAAEVLEAGRALVVGRSFDALVGVWVSVWPVLVAVGGLAAAGWVGVRRMREPSWREPRESKPASDRQIRKVAGDLETRLTDKDGTVLLGVDNDTGRPVGVPGGMVGRHTLVVGSTGSGKTTTATRLAVSVLADGGGLIVVDLKGDRETVELWRQIAATRDRRCVVWSFGGGTVYDPLAYGGVSERVRKVMALGEWTEPYYQTVAEQMLQLAIRALDEVGERPTLARLHNLLTMDRLKELGRRAGGPACSELVAEVGSMDKGQQSGLKHVRMKVGLLVQAEYGPALDPALSPGRDTVDLTRALDDGDVVVVSLSELAYGHIASRMAEVVLTDVASVAGARQARDLTGGEVLRPGMVWVDEFSAMKPGPFASLFARARSASIGLVLSTQEVSDLAREDPTFRAAVATNVGTLIAHRIHDPDSAAWVCALIGNREGWKETSQVQALNRLDGAVGGGTGMGTVRPVWEYLVHPTEVQSLPDHQAWVARLDRTADKDRVHRVRVVRLAHPVLEPEPVVEPVGCADSVVRVDEDVRPDDGDATSHHPSASVPVDLPGDDW